MTSNKNANAGGGEISGCFLTLSIDCLSASPWCYSFTFSILQHTHLCEDASIEVWPLVGTSSNEESTVGATLNGQLAGGAIAVGDKVLCTCLKVVKRVLLAEVRSSIAPLAAVLTPPSQVGHRKHTVEALEPREPARGSQLLFADLNKTFFGYFDLQNIFLNNENKYLRGNFNDNSAKKALTRIAPSMLHVQFG